MALTEEQQEKLELAQGILGYQFKDEGILLPAITHPSAVEGKPVKCSYERLEFLGDSILGAIVADAAFHEYRNLDEGGLTRIKVSLVSGASLARVAEQLGFAMELLLKAGARDAYFSPIFMKKNRPAYELNVICKEEKIGELERIIFENTTTIGIRRIPYRRSILLREIREVETPYGTAECKVCVVNGTERPYPEYESVAELAKKNQMPFTELFSLIRDLAQESSENDLTMI